MPLQSSKTRRRATSVSALQVGTLPRGKTAAASFTRFDKGSFSLAAPGLIAAGASLEVSVVIADAALNAPLDGTTQTDIVVLNAPLTLEAGLSIGAERVTAPNTIKFRIYNTGAVGVSPATNTYLYFLARS